MVEELFPERSASKSIIRMLVQNSNTNGIQFDHIERDLRDFPIIFEGEGNFST